MNCLFCGSENIRKAAYPRPTIFNNKQFDYKRCSDCGLVFIDPLPAPADYDRMYAASYHNEFYFNEQPPDYSNWFNLLEQYSREKQILDYGCGDGSFLRYFHQRGYECTGVEYDPALVNRLRNENGGIRFMTVDDFWKDDGIRCNAVFMGDVLEHLSTPADFLKKLMPKMKSGGLVAAQGPLENNANFALMVRKLVSRVKTMVNGKEAARHVPYHIFFATASNQKAVFDRAGLECRYYEVFETTWPYPEKFSAAPTAGFQYMVAKTSIALSGIVPGKLGNRFLYVGQKN